MNFADNDRLKAWMTFGVVGAVVFVIGWGIRNSLLPHRFDTTGTSNDPDALPPGVGVRVKQTVFDGYDEKMRKAWTIRADVVDGGIDRSRVEFNGHIEATLFDAPTGKPRAKITAPYALFTVATKTLQVGQKIVCRVPGTGDAGDLRMDAETMVWNTSAKQIVCPGAVNADLPNDTGAIKGQDMTIDLTTREWTMKKFHGAFVLKEGAGAGPPKIENPFGKLPL